MKNHYYGSLGAILSFNAVCAGSFVIIIRVGNEKTGFSVRTVLKS